MKHTIVRLKQSPVPLIGRVVGDDRNIAGLPAWIVQVYGYSLRTEAWLKSACSEPTTEIPAYIDIAGWLSLANRNMSPTMTLHEWSKSQPTVTTQH